MPEIDIIKQSNTSSGPGKNIRQKLFFTTILFFFFLFPFSLAIGDEGLSANYSFVLFPIILIWVKYYMKRPPAYVPLFFLLYILIFFISSIYQIEYLSFFPRRLISFILFIIMFSYLFIDIDETMVNSFKISIVAISLYFSLSALLKYTTLGPVALGFAAKGEIGSQRFGFIYVAAIWICWFYNTKSLLSVLAKYVFMVIIAIGLLLTFSRSGIVAFGVSVFLYVMNNYWAWIRNPQPRSVFKFILIALFIIGFFFVLGAIFPILVEFFNVRLFSFFLGIGEETVDLSDSDSSEGFRIFLFLKAVEFVTYNPFTGSGFLGIWVLFDDLSGSAHNQYLDVFFRTGIFGFLAYMYLLFKILNYLYMNDRSLFWGSLGILIYGLFHETFKLSQGAFIFSFLLGMTGSRKMQ